MNDLAASVIQKAWRSRTSKCDDCRWTMFNHHMYNGYCGYCTDLYNKNLAAKKIQNAWKAYTYHNCNWCNVPITYGTWQYCRGQCESCEKELLEMREEFLRDTIGECKTCGDILDECHCDCDNEYCDCHDGRSPVPESILEKRKGVVETIAEGNGVDEKDLWWDNWLEEQRLTGL